MKKLMIAAAAAALVSGVYAGCSEGSDPTTTCSKQDAVYDWQFKGKTSTGVIVRTAVGTPGVAGGSCAEGSSGTDPQQEVVRIPGALSIFGHSYICDLECFEFGSRLVNPTKAQYYMIKPLKSLVAPYRGKNFITEVKVAHVIGKAKTQYELAGVASFDIGATTGLDVQQVYDVTFAGYGVYDKKNTRVASVSGNFAGTQKIPRYPGKLNQTNCPGAGYWDCCTLDYYANSEAMSDTNKSVAYGTWTVKYNASETKKLQTKMNSYWVK